MELTTTMASTFMDTMGGPSSWRANLKEYDAMSSS